MATANTTFTQEQIDNLSGVAKKYGGFENQNFQTAVNTKYGAGSYESLNSSLKAIQAKQNTPATLQAQVTPVQANIGGTLPGTQSNVPPQLVDNTGANTASQMNQTPLEMQRNNEQSAFNAANPVGTKTEDIKYTAPENITPATQVEKTTTTTPQGETVVKKETPVSPVVDFNVGSGREQEILTNLNEGYKNAPDIFQNQDTFRNAYGYNTADQTKKKMLDAFFQSKNAQQNNPDALFAQIANNQPIYNPATKSTPAYKSAMSRFNDLNINAGLTAKELSDQLKNGSITIGSQAYKDLQAKNPQLVQNAEKLNAVNTGMGGKTDTNVIESNVGNNIIKDVKKEDVPNLQNALANNPEVKQSLATSKETKTKIDALQDNLDNLEEDIRAQLKGTGATEGYIQGLISEKSKPIVRQLNTLSRVYSTQLSDLQYYSDIVKADYTDKKAALADERNFAQQKELAKYQQDLSLKGNQAEFEQKIKQQAQMASDPYTAISTVMDEYKKLGVPFTQSIATKVADANKFIAGGGTIGEYVDKMIGDIQKKPEYKTLTTPKPTAASQVWTKLDDTTLYNQATGETKAVKAGTPVSSEEISNYTTTRNGSTNIQCGELVNDYLKDVTGVNPSGNARFGNTINDKYGAITELGRSDTPQVGGIFVSNPLNNNVGHTGIVSKVNDDGSIEVREANAQGKASGQPPVTKTYSAQQVADMRFSQAPEIKTKAGVVQEGQYSEQDIELLSELALMDGTARNTALKNSGLTLKDVTDYTNLAKQGKIPATSSQKKSATGLMNDVKNLISLNDWQDAVGRSTMFPTIPGGDAATAENAIDNLIAKLTIENLPLLKGPMSDKDIEFVKAVSSKFAKTISDDQFKNNLIELYNLSAKKAGQPEVKTLDEIKGQQTDRQSMSGAGSSNEIDLFNNIYNQ